MSKRIYHVRSKHGSQHLVRAHSPAAAIKKASEGTYTAEPANQETLVKLLQGGHDIIDAGVEQKDAFEENGSGTAADAAAV